MDPDIEMGANNPIDVFRYGSAVIAVPSLKHDLTQAEFDSEWQSLQTFLRRLIDEPKYVSKRDWQQWIERVHRLCVCAPPLPQTQDGYAWPLYQKVTTFLNEYVGSIYEKLAGYNSGRQLRSADDTLLLDAYLMEWRKWIDASKVINDVLLHLNTNGKRKNAFQEHFSYRFIHIQNPRSASDQDDERQYEIKDLFKVIWNACIITKLETRLKDCLMRLVHRDRVVRDADIFRKLCTVTQSLVEIDNIDGRHRLLETYGKIFEQPFITTTGEYYQFESVKLLKSNSISVYMEKVLSRLREEEDRTKELCHVTSHQKVRREIQQRMVQDHLHVLIAECKSMVEERRDHDLRNMYKILRPAQPPASGIEQFIETLRLKIQADMREALKAVLPLLHGTDAAAGGSGGSGRDLARAGQMLLQMFHRVLHTYRSLLRDLFENDYDVSQAIDKAVRVSLNDGSVLPQDRVPEMLAVYSDRMLRGLFDLPNAAAMPASTVAASRAARLLVDVHAAGSGDGHSSSLSNSSGAAAGGFINASTDLLANDADMEVPPAARGISDTSHQSQLGSDDAVGVGVGGNGGSGDYDTDDDAAGQYLSHYKDVSSPSTVAGGSTSAVQKLGKLIATGPRKVKIDETIEVFSFTEEKEVFRKAYQFLLAKRLINKAYKKLDEEAYFIEQLRCKCGYDFANKLWRMVQDARAEHEIHRRFARRWLPQRLATLNNPALAAADAKLIKSIKHEEDEDDMPPANSVAGSNSSNYHAAMRMTASRRARTAAAAAAAAATANVAAPPLKDLHATTNSTAVIAPAVNISASGSTSSNTAAQLGVDFHVSVLTTSAWPVSDDTVKLSQTFRLPRQLEDIANHFMRFYGEEYSCRTLRWVYSLGYAEIELGFIQQQQSQRVTTRLRAAELAEPCTAIVSNYQVALLMHLNEHDTFMLSDLGRITGLPDAEVLPHLKALVHSGLLLARHASDIAGHYSSYSSSSSRASSSAALPTTASSFMPSTVFMVNESFLPPRGVHCLRLTPSMMRDNETIGYGGESGSAVNGGANGAGGVGGGGVNGGVTSMRMKTTSFAHNPDKRNAIQAAVIRLLKKNQHMEHEALVFQVRKTLSGLLGDDPSEDDLIENFPLDEIKTTIETLIDKEYIRRDDQHKHVYHYVP